MKEETNFKKIEEIFNQNEKSITRKDIDEAKIPSWFLSDFVKKKKLNKIAPGFYAADSYTVDDYFILQKQYPKYIFSGMSALYLHYLTDKIPTDMYVTCPQGYHPSRKKNPSLIVTRISDKNILNLGITEVETMFSNKVKAYDREKTICDLIKHRDDYDSETFLKALNRYMKNKPDQNKLFTYAKLMKIEKKVFEIMEIVAYDD